MKSFFPILLCAIIIIGFISGCSKSTTDGSDTEAPAVSILQPAAGDTVGVDNVVVVTNASDDVGVTKAEFYLDGVLQSTVSTAPWQATLPITSLSDGMHKVMVKAYDAAGNVGASTEIQFVKGIRSVDVVNRIVLGELTTSANCTTCAPQNELWYNTMTGNAVYRERVVSIRYHGWFPRPTDSLWLASQTWSKPRIDYLFGTDQLSFPKSWIDGNMAGSLATNWIIMMSNELAVPAEAKITLSKTDLAGKVSLSIKVKGLTSTQYTDLRLHTVVTADSIVYNDGNAEMEHFDVMCTMLPSAAGEAIGLTKDQETTYSREINIDQQWHKNNLNVVVFVQSNASKHVLQAAKLSLK